MIVNGWQIFAHPLFIDQLAKLTIAVERARQKDPERYRATANAKLLAALNRLVRETIPADPSRPEYRQGDTLGTHRKHWFRVKFGSQRFRLFFRYQNAGKVIVLAWVNDEDSLRTYGSKSDAYSVFRAMLERDSPPDDWRALMIEAAAAKARLEKALGAARDATPS
ncbi:MAG: type II toxin-antitoxin system YhaV family toxin [Mesorhizobium sp.]|nr:type II toxin-antitoxin system YhaV family toxin [Mesorhizobium sp.]